jgi:excisionase family DNA binding protein
MDSIGDFQIPCYIASPVQKESELDLQNHYLCIEEELCMKKLLTRKELCELLRISGSTLYRIQKDGELLSVNGRGKKQTFDPDTVEAWIKSHRTAPIPVFDTITPAKVLQHETEDFEKRQNHAKMRLLAHSAGRKTAAK